MGILGGIVGVMLGWAIGQSSIWGRISISSVRRCRGALLVGAVVAGGICYRVCFRSKPWSRVSIPRDALPALIPCKPYATSKLDRCIAVSELQCCSRYLSFQYQPKLRAGSNAMR